MSKYAMITTKQLEEIRRRNAAGENDVVISQSMGLSYSAVQRNRLAMGLPRSRNNKKTYTYTVYDANTDQLLAYGTVDQCTAALGFANYNSFYGLVCRAMKGKQKKYSILREAIEEA